MIKTRLVDVVIRGENDKIVFEKRGFVVPDFWTDQAATIVASKYSQPDEDSVFETIGRIVDKIVEWGILGK